MDMELKKVLLQSPRGSPKTGLDGQIISSYQLMGII